MSKMLFIKPKPPNLNVFFMYLLPRLANFILATLMKQRAWEVEIIVEELQEISFGQIKSFDLVGISAITSYSVIFSRGSSIFKFFFRLLAHFLNSCPYLYFLTMDGGENGSENTSSASSTESRFLIFCKYILGFPIVCLSC